MKAYNRIAEFNCKSSIIKNVVFIIMIAVISISLMSCEKSAKIEFNTNYQALLLSNNNAYFGRIENMDSQFITLTDIFYIQTKPTDDPKLVNNVLIKRGKEIHKPDKMYISREHVIAIEPVANDSQ
ncbi:MAG: hypothetical protein ABRQ32_04570, partial [Smithellaceae bacterium]